MRTHKLTISIALLTALLGLAIACSKKPSDDTIAKDIQDKIAADPDTKDSQITVAAKDAKVTMTGQVKTPAAQQKIEQIAREEPGAAGVDDQTAVQPDASAPHLRRRWHHLLRRWRNPSLNPLSFQQELPSQSQWDRL
jgi:hypothetical protein